MRSRIKPSFGLRSDLSLRRARLEGPSTRPLRGRLRANGARVSTRPVRSAVTIVELVIAMVLLTVVLAAVFDVLRLSTQGAAKGDAEAMAAQRLEIAIATLRADLRAAQIDSEPGHNLTIGDSGRELSFPRATPDGPKPVVQQVSYKAAADGRLVRTVGGVEDEVSSGITAARFTLYSRRIDAPLLTYTTRLHSDYAPLFVRIELTAMVQDKPRDLVTSVALQPFCKSQLDPYWNPVPVE